jgi:hypothetical protein
MVSTDRSPMAIAGTNSRDVGVCTSDAVMISNGDTAAALDELLASLAKSVQFH